jgi:glucose-6-phosphate isomerase
MSLQSPIRLRSGRPTLAPGFSAEAERARRYVDLAPVAAVAPGRAGRRVQYWAFSGVAEDVHRGQLRELPLSYDVTVLSPNPMGWECCKTHGHVHASSAGDLPGYPELYEVLEGKAGFLVQDLLPGPRASQVTMITASAGDTVVIPPGLHHATINLGASTLVVCDLVARSSDDDYRHLREAHGMAYFVGQQGDVVPNRRYRDLPPLVWVAAASWSRAPQGPIYQLLVDDPDALAWLWRPELIVAAAMPHVKADTPV